MAALAVLLAVTTHAVRTVARLAMQAGRINGQMSKDEYVAAYGTDQHQMTGTNNFGGAEAIYTPGTGIVDDGGWCAHRYSRCYCDPY